MAKVQYVRGEPSFTVPFDDPRNGNNPFNFATCGQDSRITVTVDDSDLPNDHSIVYFNSETQEFVFVGY